MAKDIDNEIVILAAISIWCFLFTLLLLPFGLHQFHAMILGNKTTNEELRQKWNGDHRNR